MLIVIKESKPDQIILHQNEIHTFVDKQIVKYKAQKGVACFYKIGQRPGIIGEKRIMKFDTKNRKFHVDGTTGKRLYKKGKKRTTTPENNMLVTDVEVKSGYKFRNVPLNQRLRYLLIGKKVYKFRYLDTHDVYEITFPKYTNKLITDLSEKKFEDHEQKWFDFTIKFWYNIVGSLAGIHRQPARDPFF